MKDRMRIHKEIALFTSRKEFYNKAQELGHTAVQIFGKEEKGKTQLNNLQNIVNTSLKVTDTVDYIKRQIGNKRGFEKENFGEKLINYLYVELEKTRNAISASLSELNLDEYDRQQIHLLLCRQFINSMVIHYIYELQEEKDAKSN